jgi:hypothetical protein
MGPQDAVGIDDDSTGGHAATSAATAHTTATHTAAAHAAAAHTTTAHTTTAHAAHLSERRAALQRDQQVQHDQGHGRCSHAEPQQGPLRDERFESGQ